MSCVLHIVHKPEPLRLVEHHIQPLGMGGPDTQDNRAVVCDTGHYNVHRLMGYLLRNLPMPKLGARTERKMAQQGYDSWVAAGKPGKPVYELLELTEYLV